MSNLLQNLGLQIEFILDAMRLRPIRFSGEQAIEAAKNGSGLSDFGSDAFLEPLNLSTNELNSIKRLTFGSKVMARESFRQFLIRRLRIVRDHKENPEISEIPIKRPIIITGLPRTGTTLFA